MPIDAVAARAQVDSLILESAPLGYDTEGDMLKVSDKIAEFGPSENDQVFGGMSDSEMTRWAAKVYAPGTLGVGDGLSADQRHTLFERMGGHFSGQLQARAMTKFNQGRGDQVALGEEIARQTDRPKEKAAFIRSVAPYVAGPELNIDPGILGDALTLAPNEVGVAAAKVLVSLRESPDDFNDAVLSLQAQGKLDDVVEAAVGMSRYGTADMLAPAVWSAGEQGTSYDPALLRQLVDAGCAVGSPQARAALADSVEALRLNIVRGTPDEHGHTLPQPAQEIGLTAMVKRLRET